MIEAQTPVIEVKNLSIGFRSRKLVTSLIENLDLKAFKGELIALIGSNGIGKSTFIRTVCQLHRPLKGELFFNSIPANSLTRVQLAQRVSLVTTELVRSGRLKVKDLVALGRFPYSNWYGQLNVRDHQLVMDSLQQVAMEPFAERFTTELSDGEFQRVMIARALAQDTPVIILDEPTAFLDLPNKYLLVKLLWQLCHKQNKTILFSTHDINIAMQFADLFWIFHNKGIHSGAPEDMVLSNQIEQIFNKQNLFFDGASTQFKIRKELVDNVHLIGKGTPAVATQMALERMGFSTDCNKPALFTVNIPDYPGGISWEINWEDMNLKVSSIIQLQQFIYQHIKLNQ